MDFARWAVCIALKQKSQGPADAVQVGRINPLGAQHGFLCFCGLGSLGFRFEGSGSLGFKV